MGQQEEGAKKRVEKQKWRPGRMQLTVIVGLLILAVILIYALVKNNSVYTSFEVVSQWSRGDNTSVYYQMMDRGMLRYSKDGVAMANKSGEVIWNQTYEMASPVLARNDAYVAIGDLGANDIYIFDEYGQVGRVTTDVPIQELQISRQGVTAVILSDADSNYINLYDRKGTALGSIKASLENTGYPLAIGLSPDATKLVASYLSLDGGNVQTRVVFYDFSQIEGDHVTDTQMMEGLYPKVVFISDTRVALYGENGFALFALGSDVSQIQTTEFEDEITSVFEGDQRMGFVFRNQDENGKYRMELYDMAGRKNTTVWFDFDYDTLAADDDEIILYNEQEIMIYQYDGRLRFKTALDSTISGVMASWEDGMYWLIDSQSLREIRIE